MKKFADLHIHPFLRPLAEEYTNPASKEADLWYQDLPKPKERDDFRPKYTASDFTSLAQGNVKIAFVAHYSIEQQWFDSVSTGVIIDLLTMYATGYKKKYIDYVQSPEYNYFKQFMTERKLLEKAINNPKTLKINGQIKQITAKIPQNIDELQQFLSEDNTLIIIPTIEGVSSIFKGNKNVAYNIDIQELKQTIRFLKNSPHTPFFITFSHHFYNGLAGHSVSIFSYNKIIDKLEDILFQQREGTTLELTPEGQDIVKYLLSIGEYKNSGKRILIDIKHMNVRSREKFYQIVLQHNDENPDDKIPIIASHVAYSGQRTFAQLQKIAEKDVDMFLASKGDLDEADINLCDDDVVKIFASEGIIGINLDERILANKKICDQAKEYKNNLPEMRLFWAKQIVKNITGMGKAIVETPYLTNKSRLWDTFAIGSDFDGFINPVDGFITEMEMDELQDFLAQALALDDFFKKHSFGLTAAQVANKIMFENARNFLLKHYWKHSDNDLTRETKSV